MKTIIKGKVVKNRYSVISHTKEIEANHDSGETKTIYTEKPELKKETEIVDWVDICSFDHEPFYNKRRELYFLIGPTQYINIGNEEVEITEEKFVADLDEFHLFSNKIVRESDDVLSKEIAEIDYSSHLKVFNESLIATNERMKAYCKLHKMDPAETDAIELFKLLYDTSFYVIKNGKIRTQGSNLYTFTNELDNKINIWKELETEES